jgi:hypothetical protein
MRVAQLVASAGDLIARWKTSLRREEEEFGWKELKDSTIDLDGKYNILD